MRRLAVLSAALFFPSILSLAAPAVAGSGQGGLAATAITVADLARSIRFYEFSFGLIHAGAHETASIKEQFLAAKDPTHSANLVLARTDGRPPNTANPRLVFFVDDIAAAMTRLADAGASGATTPQKAGPLLIAFARDPDGYLLEIIQGGEQIK